MSDELKVGIYRRYEWTDEQKKEFRNRIAHQAELRQKLKYKGQLSSQDQLFLFDNLVSDLDTPLQSEKTDTESSNNANGNKFDLGTALAAATLGYMAARVAYGSKPKVKKPKAVEQCMIFLLPRDCRDEIMGDLEEDYRVNIVPKLGKKIARRWYWFQAIRTIWHYNGLTARIIRLVEGIRNSGK